MYSIPKETCHIKKSNDHHKKKKSFLKTKQNALPKSEFKDYSSTTIPAAQADSQKQMR